jgi:hypothetical protein
MRSKMSWSDFSTMEMRVERPAKRILRSYPALMTQCIANPSHPRVTLPAFEVAGVGM